MHVGIGRKGTVKPPDNSCNTTGPRSYLETFAALIRDRRVSHGAFRLWHALRDYTNAASKCFPGQDSLAADIACNIHSIKPWTQELVAAGWLKVEGGNGRRFNYTVLDGIGKPLRKGSTVEQKTVAKSGNATVAENSNATVAESGNEPLRKVATKVRSPINQAQLREVIGHPHLEKQQGWQLRKDLRESSDPAEREAIKAEIARRKGKPSKPARLTPPPTVKPAAGQKRFTPSPELAAQLRSGFQAAIAASKP